jgi:hypothetical protein
MKNQQLLTEFGGYLLLLLPIALLGWIWLGGIFIKITLSIICIIGFLLLMVKGLNDTERNE